MKLSQDLLWRDLIKDKTFKDVTWLDTPQAFYHGVDVGSSDSLTIGNLAALLLAKRLLKAGWKTYLLVGGATSLIGDPGGKTKERDLVSREQVESNKAAIKKQVEYLFEGEKFELVDNYDWFKEIGYLEFLREVGKHYSMTELVQRDYIATRLGKDGGGISYAEFSYSLVQGYDFWHLYKEYGVVLQIGGSDQWGNMLSGVPLIRKKEGNEAEALSMPLIIDKNTGAKFGKSEDGAIWLDAEKTSPYKFYQFWLNASDEDVEDYLKIFTELNKDEIEQIMRDFENNKNERTAQKKLANEVTKLVHGQRRANAVQKASSVLFGVEDFLALGNEELEVLASELTTVVAMPSIEATLASAELASSNSEARRFIESGAVSLNGQKIADEQLPPLRDGLNLLKRGKNKFALVEKK